jgi:peptidoglycan LD-endopeptidase LytH
MPKRFLIISITVVAVITAAITTYYLYQPNAARMIKFRQWINNPAAHADWKLSAGTQCGLAPFLFPTDGMVGFLWGDMMGKLHRHQGIDIFAGTGINLTKVVAAYPGYLSRLPDWKSSVIVRVPNDPLEPSRQIWLYYTHMADQNGNSFISDEFSAGTSEKYIEAGTLLGYQGDYSGDPNNPVGVHLHFSIVKDDGTGHFKNELDINNTYDPSPYFGLTLNAYENQAEVPVCDSNK